MPDRQHEADVVQQRLRVIARAELKGNIAKLQHGKQLLRLQMPFAAL
jgi:hypothetical protein